MTTGEGQLKAAERVRWQGRLRPLVSRRLATQRRFREVISAQCSVVSFRTPASWRHRLWALLIRVRGPQILSLWSAVAERSGDTALGRERNAAQPSKVQAWGRSPDLPVRGTSRFPVPNPVAADVRRLTSSLAKEARASSRRLLPAGLSKADSGGIEELRPQRGQDRQLRRPAPQVPAFVSRSAGFRPQTRGMAGTLRKVIRNQSPVNRFNLPGSQVPCVEMI